MSAAFLHILSVHQRELLLTATPHSLIALRQREGERDTRETPDRGRDTREGERDQKVGERHQRDPKEGERHQKVGERHQRGEEKHQRGRERQQRGEIGDISPVSLGNPGSMHVLREHHWAGLGLGLSPGTSPGAGFRCGASKGRAVSPAAGRAQRAAR